MNPDFSVASEMLDAVHTQQGDRHLSDPISTPSSSCATSMSPSSLRQLEQHDAFIARHIGPNAEEQRHMLDVLGFAACEDLIKAVVPVGMRREDAMPLGLFSEPKSEVEALAQLRSLAAQNQVFRSFIGQGYYGTHTPQVIARNVLENPAWYTAYTPYQPEISQGRLEALLNFQQMITDLTALDIANASMLDEATAAAEAMTLLLRAHAGAVSSKVFYVAEDVLPQTIEVLQTRARPLGIQILIGPAQEALKQGPVFGVLLQYPGADGSVQDYTALTAAIHEAKGAVVVAADLLALTVLAPPGEWGADIAIGNTQRFGVPMGFGGPHAAYFCVRDALKRHLPGRLIGVTKDAQGHPALRLALQTREQHIRREKATSNICTAQALLAMMASFYAVYHGPQGLRAIAQRVHRLAVLFYTALKQLGFTLRNDTFFDTLTIYTGAHTAALHAHAYAVGVNLRQIDDAYIGVSFDETTTRADLQALWSVFATVKAGTANPIAHALDIDALDHALLQNQNVETPAWHWPAAMTRQSPYLTHPVFNRYHAEHEMLRYLRSLADKDLALDRTMIPLGSCTMKLNATSEMLPVSWPEFAQIHPLAPAEQTQGYRTMIEQLEQMLAACTGYAAVSLQPNAGSQGEYAGLLIIQAYHASRGQSQRNICLVPASAHGTNPASANMVGMKVVVVACDAKGNIDLVDLRAKVTQYADTLAALMLTYPSTHGVFERSVKEVCDLVHAHGGQVYIDGANMNAMVGIMAPGQFGGDVSHLNLHKTFCIPHGGGGPGVGPVAVAEHLKAFLPNQYSTGYARHTQGIGAVSAAAYGSASILPVSWMYVAMMGASGLKAATQTAILSANYVAQRLHEHYPVLYTDEAGLVAHECILDLRPLKETSGITVEDVAKRLIDYGFHAPTMSFPVPGTLMVEPTESESLAELNRFIDAMISIRMEIRAIEEGRADRLDNPLKHAPHTAAMVVANNWSHAYSRELAAYPLPTLANRKYWPVVARADQAHGDRNLFCSCLPVE